MHRSRILMNGRRWRSTLVYGVAVAAGAFLLEWIGYRYAVRAFATEIYIVGIAVMFLALGVFLGARLFGRQAPGSDGTNQAVVQTLGISERELEVLALIANGHSNNEIGEQLFVSPNTVKTHVANLFRKLEVSRRTQAVQKARGLGILA